VPTLCFLSAEKGKSTAHPSAGEVFHRLRHKPIAVDDCPFTPSRSLAIDIQSMIRLRSVWIAIQTVRQRNKTTESERQQFKLQNRTPSDFKMKNRTKGELKLQKHTTSDLKLQNRTDSELKLQNRTTSHLNLQNLKNSEIKLQNRTNSDLKLQNQTTSEFKQPNHTNIEFKIDNVTVGTSGYIGALNKQSQQIILNVFQYVTKTRQGKGAIVETAKAVGISRQVESITMTYIMFLPSFLTASLTERSIMNHNRRILIYLKMISSIDGRKNTTLRVNIKFKMTYIVFLPSFLTASLTERSIMNHNRRILIYLKMVSSSDGSKKTTLRVNIKFKLSLECHTLHLPMESHGPN
ncbi:hypothetical protein C0J52_26981, partial [Blattella germanica]